jgi:protein-S-isoprenylcysteine O-methyltransferase Ste14
VETVAYVVALVTLMAVPAAGAVWFLVHPLIHRWRRLGPVGTYLVVGAAVVGIMYGMYLARDPLLKIRFGVRTPLVCAGAVLFGIGSWIRAGVRRQLSTSAVLGLPEISEEAPRRLVTRGIYSRMRHPRYVAVGLGVAGMALFTNYLTLYVLVAAYVPTIYLIARLEEKELVERFGEAYVEYSREVPRFVPRFGPRGKSRGNAN